MRVRLLALAQAGGPADARWLTPEEAARAQAMRSPARRQQYLAGHWQARLLAAELAGDAPRDWRWHQEGGAPQLQGRDGARLQVSISHSGDRLAIAVAAHAIGVDLELPRRPRDWVAIAGFALAPEEARAVAAAEDAADIFHRYWTLKEAEGKRAGIGLLPARSRRLLALPSGQGEAEAWQWRLAGGAYLALAGQSGQAPPVDGLAPGTAVEGWRYRPMAD